MELIKIDGLIKMDEMVPVVPLREFVVFPNVVLHFDVNREESIKAVEWALKSDKRIFIVTQKNSENLSLNQDNLYSMGVLAEVRQILRQGDDSVRVLVEGICRAQAAQFDFNSEFIRASIIEVPEENSCPVAQREAFVRKARELFAEYLGASLKVTTDLIMNLVAYDSLGTTADYILVNMPLKSEEKQSLLEETQALSRIQRVIEILVRELEILKLQNVISTKLKTTIDESQKEYFLREQIKVISQELGEGSDPRSEADEYKKKLKELNLPEEVYKKLIKECNSFAKMPAMSPDINIQRNYLDFCLSLPWNSSTKDSINITKAKKILDKDHFGLKEVKERIIEFLAVKKLAPDIKGQIICLSGPPGVGKTSIVKSLAKAMGRKYVRISLGGVGDESEIRGHRKTYIGAMPGRILSALCRVKSNNPVILLDEVDKLSKDYKGDPAAALLELLDPEQNFQFHDRYLDLPFDLSKALFVVTANDKNRIPGPLYDRMEIIDLYSYTYEEKFNIAKNHLVAKQLSRHGLTKRNFSLKDDALEKLIECYTREAGVRELSRQLSSLMRKVACDIVEGKAKSVSITTEKLSDMLGPEKYKKDKLDTQDQIGVVNGLAWTPVGGESLPIEVALMKGKGRVQVTGSLGDVMKESAQIAVSYIRSNSDKLGINDNFHKTLDIHIHAPEGAIRKDGPSAGVTMTTALVSALSHTPVYASVAMTGEITLKGKVLPIGGLKEKSMAAYKKGIKTVIIPSGNENDLQKIDDVVKNSVNFIMADNLDTVFEYALDDKRFKKHKLDEEC